MPKSNVRRINGVEITGIPDVGDVPVATSATEAAWGSAGAAGIDLQATTPGTQQTGHGNISGRFIAEEGLTIGDPTYVPANSTLRLGGSLATSFRTINGVPLAADGDTLAIQVISTISGAASVTLPQASTCGGRIYLVLNTSETGFTVLVTPFAGDTINGAASYTFNTRYECVFLQSTGTQWVIVAKAGNGSGGGSGTVTSVALTVPSGFSVSGSPITASGTLAITGTLNIAAGGTGQTTATAAFTALSPTTTKGDLIVDNGTDPTRLGVGTDGYVLTADSAEATGVKWEAPGGSTDYAAVWHLGAISYYANLTDAKTAAVSGDTIYVSPGTYNEKNLLKNGVNWWFAPGAKVTYTSATTGSIFDDTSTGTNGAVTCVIGGHGEFTYSGSSGGYSVMHLENTSSVVAFHARLVKSTVSTGAGIYAYGASILLNIDEINITSGSSGGNQAIQLNNSATVVQGRVGKIVAVASSVLVYSGELNLSADRIESTNTYPLEFWGGTARITANYVYTGAGTYAIECRGGTAYVTANEVRNSTGSGRAVRMNDAGATLYLSANLISTSNGSNATIVMSTGTLHLLKGRIVNTNSTGVPVTIDSTGALILYGGVTLIAGASAAESVSAAAARDLRIYGVVSTNIAPHANVTVRVGTLTVDGTYVI